MYYLEQASFREAHRTSTCHDDVIEYPHLDKVERFRQALCE